MQYTICADIGLFTHFSYISDAYINIYIISSNEEY